MLTDCVKEIEKGCNILMSHVPALHKCMRTLPYRGSQIKGGMPVLNEQKMVRTSLDSNSEVTV